MGLNVVEKIKEIYGDRCSEGIREHLEGVHVEEPDSAIVKKISKLEKIFSNEIRVSILLLLAQSPLPVCALVAVLNKDQTLISHNLTALKKLGVISEKRFKKYRIYSLRKDKIKELLDDVKYFLKIS